MKIALGTNVVVSGLLTPFGPAGEIVRMVSSGRLIVLYDARILAEYREVLHRPKFQFDVEEVETFIGFIMQNGQLTPAVPLQDPLPDPDDEPFLEIALSGNAACIITGNKVHFPRPLCRGVKILSPSEFIAFYRLRSPPPNTPP